MSHILRNQSNTNFTTVDNEFIYNSSLSTKAVGLLIRLLALPDNWCFSKEGIYSIIPEGKKFVDTTLKELKEQGYLEIKKVKNYENNLWDYEYSIYSVSRFCEYLPDGNLYNFKTKKKGRGIDSKRKNQTVPMTDIDKGELLVDNIQKLIQEQNRFVGTISELKDLLPNSLNIYEGNLSKLLRDNINTFEKNEICINFRKSNGKKIIEIISKKETLQPTLKNKYAGSVGDTQKGVVAPTLENISVYKAGSVGDTQKGVIVPTLENEYAGSVGDTQKGTLPNGGLYKRLNNKEIYRQIEKEIKEEINYGHLKQILNDEKEIELLDDVVSVLSDVYSNSGEVIRVGKEQLERNRVIDTFKELEEKHIEYVIHNVLAQNKKIVNVYSYLMKSLFTAPKSFNLSKYSKTKKDLPDWYSQTDSTPPSKEMLENVLELQRKLKEGTF